MRLWVEKAFYYSYSLLLAVLLLTFNVMRVFELSEGVKFNIAVSDVLVPLIGIMLVADMIIKRTWNPVRHVGWFILLMAWLMLTSWLAIGNEQLVVNSWPAVIGEWVKTGLCVIYFYIGYQMLRHLSFKWFVRLYSFGYGFFIAYGMVVVVAVNRGVPLPFIHENAERFFLGTYHDPNQAALYITLSYFLLLYGINSEKILWKIIYGVIAMASFGALFLTDSRGGLLGFCAALMVYVCMTYYDRISGMVTLMFSMMMMLFGSMIFDSRINDGRFFGSLARSFMNFDRGLDVREGLMRAAWVMGRDYPLTGVGRGNYIVNAGTYADLMDLEIEYNIPHNTYVGLFAEVGIIGLLLYAVPVCFIMYYMIKGGYVQRWSIHRYWLAALAAVGIGIGIEAFVLNVENRRTLWLMAGVLLYALEMNCGRNHHIEVDRGYVKSDNRGGGIQPGYGIRKFITSFPLHSIINTGLGLLTLLVFLMTVREVHVPTTWQWHTDGFVQVLPVPDDYLGETIEVEYYLYAHQRGLAAQDTVAVTIEEHFSGGGVKVHEFFVYPRTNGTCRLTFEKTQSDSEIIFRLDKVSKGLRAYRFQFKRLLTNEQVLFMDRAYYLIPQEEEDEHLYSRWEEKNKELYDFRRYNPKLTEFEEVTFDGLFTIEGIEAYVDGKETMVEVTYKAHKKPEMDYNLWVYANPDNVHYLPERRFLSNNEYLKSLETVMTGQWEAGSHHTVTYVIPRDYGWYRLVTGIYYREDDTTRRLSVEETGRTYVDAGWFEAKGQ